jgi:hypothetical protein
MNFDLSDLEAARSAHLPDRYEDHIKRGKPIDVAIREEERIEEEQQIYVATYSADLASLANPGGAAPFTLFPEGVNLPKVRHIGTVYVENNGTTANLTVYLGGSANGIPLGKIIPGHYKRICCPDGITSVTVAANVSTDTGLVIVTLATHRWSPTAGTL